MIAVDTEASEIGSVTAVHIETGEKVRLHGRLFADCTGDGTVGFLAGADWTMGRESRDEYGERSAPVKADDMVMGASVQWYSRKCPQKTVFPEFSYGVEFNASNCEKVTMGEWTWETGMNRDQIADAERVRDYGLLVIYSNWSWLKNHSGDAAYADRGSKERIGQLYACAGATRVPVDKLEAGDIGCTVKLKDVKTGNTLNGKDTEWRFDFIKMEIGRAHV